MINLVTGIAFENIFSRDPKVLFQQISTTINPNFASCGELLYSFAIGSQKFAQGHKFKASGFF